MPLISALGRNMPVGYEILPELDLDIMARTLISLAWCARDTPVHQDSHRRVGFN